MGKYRWRSAVSGRWVKAAFARLFPWFTVRERFDIRETYRDTMRRYPKTMELLAKDERE
jgi:hypothetical protein